LSYTESGTTPSSPQRNLIQGHFEDRVVELHPNPQNPSAAI